MTRETVKQACDSVNFFNFSFFVRFDSFNAIEIKILRLSSTDLFLQVRWEMSCESKRLSFKQFLTNKFCDISNGLSVHLVTSG